MRDDRKDELYEPPLPPLDTCGYLLAILFELGPASSNGMGLSPISWEELRAYQWQLGIQLTPWEARTIVQVSKDYISESRRAEKADCPAPWVDEDSDEYRAEVLPKRIKSFLRE